MASETDPRDINIEGIADGDLLAYNAADSEFQPLTPPTEVSIPAAITGGEAPTEAEHNALRLAVANLQAALVAAGLMLAD